MTGKEETFIRCRYCGRLLHIGDLAPNEVYCKKCERTFDVNECDIVLRGITCVPSDYHYEWKEEKNLEDELTKYKRAFEILKKKFSLDKTEIFGNGNLYFINGIDSCWEISREEYELLEELMKDENKS